MSELSKTEYYIYILECSDNTLYTGITTNIEDRIKIHNEGKGAKYTSPRLPVKLKAVWSCSNRSEASKVEYYIKKQKRCKKLKYIQSGSLLESDVYSDLGLSIFLI